MIVHLPIVLLLLAPILIAVGAALPPLRGRSCQFTALVLLVLGTAGLFLADPPTGTTAASLLSRHDWVVSLYQSHSQETRIIFSGLVAIYIGILLIPRFLHRRYSRLFCTVLPLAFLILYSAGTVYTINMVCPGGVEAYATETRAHEPAVDPRLLPSNPERK